MANDKRNVVLVGNKPVMSYVIAVMAQLHSDQPEVVIKARGQAINRAVDVAEVVRNKFLKGAEVQGIEIGTERLKDSRGRQTNVSSIAIRMRNPNPGKPAEPSPPASSGAAAPPAQ
jgi:DNA-binding protein